jgi:hypothetical protein
VQEGAEDGFEAGGIWLGEAGVDWCGCEGIELYLNRCLLAVGRMIVGPQRIDIRAYLFIANRVQFGIVVSESGRDVQGWRHIRRLIQAVIRMHG